MRRSHVSIAGLSVLFALGLAAWEVYFFWLGGTRFFGSLEGSVGIFTPDRLAGFRAMIPSWTAASSAIPRTVCACRILDDLYRPLSSLVFGSRLYSRSQLRGYHL